MTRMVFSDRGGQTTLSRHSMRERNALLNSTLAMRCLDTM